ncbi:YwbE family protein [Clostridium sporogenes]
MNGTIRENIRPGTKVRVVEKQDQHSGKLTEGVVEKLLTKSAIHPRGIKVILESGIVGRVKEILR